MAHERVSLVRWNFDLQEHRRVLLTSVKIPSGGPAKPGSGEHPYATARRFYFGGTGECGPKRQVGPKHPERALCLKRDRTFGKHGTSTAVRGQD